MWDNICNTNTPQSLCTIKCQGKKKSRKKKLSQKEPYKIGKKKSNQREKKKSIWKDTIKKKEAEFLKQEKT